MLKEVKIVKPELLKARIEEMLWGDDRLQPRDIRVTVIGRDVWLEGSVSTPEMYDQVERDVGEIGGVGDITNNLICTEEPYDIRDHRDGMDLRGDYTTDPNAENRLQTRIDPFGVEADEPMMEETHYPAGGPVGGDSGNPWHPMDADTQAPLASESVRGEEPWRYQQDGVNAGLDREPVLPPEENEV